MRYPATKMWLKCSELVAVVPGAGMFLTADVVEPTKGKYLVISPEISGSYWHHQWGNTGKHTG